MSKKSLIEAYEKYLSYNLDDIKNDVPNFTGALSFFVEQICDTNAESLKEFLLAENTKDLFMPPPWIRLIIIQNILLSNQDDKEFFTWAVNNLSLFYDSELSTIKKLKSRIQ